jgi:hypothetical protein
MAFRAWGAVKARIPQNHSPGGGVNESRLKRMKRDANRIYTLTIMRLQPTISFEQYRDTCGAVAAAKPKAVRKRSWKGYVGLGIACLALGLSPQIPAARIPALELLVFVALYSILSKPLARRSQDKCFRTIFHEEQELLNNQVLTIDESGITCDIGNGQATTHHTWKAFKKRIDLPDAYIFLPSPNSFIRVPKELVPLSDLELVWRWSSTVPTVLRPELSVGQTRSV